MSDVPAGLDEFVGQAPPVAGPAPASAPNEPPGLSEFITPEIQQEKYGTVPQQVAAGLEATAQGVIGPFAPAIERSLGVFPEGIRGREEANPITHGLGEAAGLVGSSLFGVGEGALLAKAGEGVNAALKLGGEGASALSKIAGGASRLGVESALMQAGDEGTKFITQDPNQSAESAITNIGLSSLIGGGLGAGFGSLSPLLKAAGGVKLGQFIEDFKGRINELKENPDPNALITDELTDKYNNTRAFADEVYGSQNLKDQAVQKLMPEMNDKISEQASDIISKVQSTVDEMAAKPRVYPERLTGKLTDDLVQLKSAVSEAQSPGEIFNAIQDFKSTAQGYSKYDKFVKPVDEAYDFVKKAKDLAYNSRVALEDSNVWGKAADVQKDINKAFVAYKPTLEDFEKKFTTEVAGERQIDPGKVSTYLNQAGKDSQKIKQQMLGNFLDASEKYEKVVNDTYSKLGVESPVIPSSVNGLKQTLETLTPGAKLADALVKKGMTRLGGEALGIGTGAAIGHAVGAGGIGALIGEHALGPFYSSILPAIIKPLLGSPASTEGLKAASEMGIAAIKGESLINRASKALFNRSVDVIPSHLIPSEAKRDKIKESIDRLQTDASGLMKAGGQTGYYMPDHGAALSAAATRATQYLASLKPNTTKLGPLDPDRQPSQVEESKYNRAIDLAEQPLLAVKSIKEGTLTPQDVQTIHTIYPNLYDKLSQTLTNEMINHVSKDNPIPYATRLSLSLFLGQSLDASMTPQAILAAQPKGPQAPQTQQSKGSPKGSMKELTGIGRIAQTQGQSRESGKLIDRA